jgi:DmsE family decaheme c-type cytochrome
MGRFTRRLSPKAAVAVALVMWGAVVVSVAALSPTDPIKEIPGVLVPPPTIPQAQSPATTPPPSGGTASGFAGDATCLTCHEDKNKGYEGTPHARVNNKRTPAGSGSGCESCHGPGQAHVDAGGDKALIKNPSTLTVTQASEMCTTCHNRDAHSEWDGSKHDSRNVGCTSCHSVHAAKSEAGQLKSKTISETCVQCHQQQSNKVRRSAHMPVVEGKMECTTCHNPHGSQNVKMLREGNSVTESCATCHAEKRGPFLFEHAVGRENCVTCHDPHGSNNDRMLVAKVPMLCQRCHNHSRHPATVYEQTQVNNRSNRVAGRACLNCHSMVHGSNHPTSGKYFMR